MDQNHTKQSPLSTLPKLRVGLDNAELSSFSLSSATSTLAEHEIFTHPVLTPVFMFFILRFLQKLEISSIFI